MMWQREVGLSIRELAMEQMKNETREKKEQNSAPVNG
jgi:hypothetical protein